MASTKTSTAPAKAKTMTAKDRKAIVAAREAGTTLAELRKAWPQYTTDQIREVLPVLPKATRKAAPEPTTDGQPTGYSGSGATTGENDHPAPKPTAKAPVPVQPQRESFKAGAVGTRQYNKAMAQYTEAVAALAPKPAAKKAPAQPKAPADPKLAAKVVKLRDTDGLSWLKIGAQLHLAPEADSAKAGASRARTLYRSVKGADADTGPLAKA